MRYIGNKTRLIRFIRDRLRRTGLKPGIVHDAFAGTGAVGRALKQDGWRVMASDLMTFSWVFQRAYIVAPPRLRFDQLRARHPEVFRDASGDATDVASALSLTGDYLTWRARPRRGPMWRHFSPAG